jgi:adenosylcobinamide-GDP ribazoletransferase
MPCRASRSVTQLSTDKLPDSGPKPSGHDLWLLSHAKATHPKGQDVTLPRLAQLPGDIAACIGFYTRLPIGHTLSDARPFIETQWAAPVAGAVVGLGVGLTLWLGTALGIPTTIAAALALALGIALTGALHEDGLADMCDGFGGGRTRERKLEIMRDSRVGTYGVLALVLSALTRWAALTSLALMSPITMVLAIVAAHAASRATIPALMMRLPAARRDGLSATAGTPAHEIATLAIILGAVFALGSGLAFATLAVVLLGATLLLVEHMAKKHIGGQTGDVAGALQQFGEIILLTLAATLLI